MSRFRLKYHQPGTAPGTLRAPTEKRVETVRVRVIDYTTDQLEEREVDSLEEAFRYRESSNVTWIDVVGLHDIEVLQDLGTHFGLHPLALEDVLHTQQRPKQEDYGDNIFIVQRLLHLDERLQSEQISIFLGSNFVLTFQEIEGDVFDPVRERLRHGQGRIRKLGADYLAYALIDAVVDSFFPILERFSEHIEAIEEELMESPSRDSLEGIHRIKTDLLLIRRAAWPQRELLAGLERNESGLIHRETRPFLRDCYDHAIQIIDILETYRDLASGLMDLYLSSISNRMNEVMKVLTVMASIFIPLTFLAGIYGMNFDPEASPWNMPELQWYWGYPAVWTVMIAIAGGMLWLFRKKEWL